MEKISILETWQGNLTIDCENILKESRLLLSKYFSLIRRYNSLKSSFTEIVQEPCNFPHKSSLLDSSKVCWINYYLVYSPFSVFRLILEHKIVIVELIIYFNHFWNVSPSWICLQVKFSIIRYLTRRDLM